MNNLRLGHNALRLEIWLTQAMVVMPAINLLFADIGMSQIQIGISQAVFTVVALTVNIPTGWLADRYSRRFANAIGDAIAASAFVVYALADSLTGVLLAEALLAIGMGASMGADSALLKGYCKALGISYSREVGFTRSIGPLFMIAGSLLGGYMLQYGLRVGFWAEVGIFALCMILSLMTKDLLPSHKAQSHPLGDMASVVADSVKRNKQLSARIASIAVLNESTHVLVFIATPLFLRNGLSVGMLGLAWALWQGSWSLGSWLSKQKSEPIPAAKRLRLAYGAVVLGYYALLVLPAPWSLVGMLVLGAEVGWLRGVREPTLLAACDESKSSTVLSVAATASSLLYVPLVIVVNWLAGLSLTYALLFNLVFFGALGLLALRYQARNP